MPKPPINLPQYPNVPNAPGVPVVARPRSGGYGSTVATSFSGLLSSKAFDLIEDAINTPWALYLSQVYSADDAPLKNSVFGDHLDVVYFTVAYANQSNIANAPLEGGDFVSYNKTLQPDNHQVGISCGGQDQDRKDFINIIKSLSKGTDLLVLQTPDGVFENLNLINVNWQRTGQSGAQIVKAVLTLQEVRIYASTRPVNTKTGYVTVTQEQGTVGAVDPTPAQSQAIEKTS